MTKSFGKTDPCWMHAFWNIIITFFWSKRCSWTVYIRLRWCVALQSVCVCPPLPLFPPLPWAPTVTGQDNSVMTALVFFYSFLTHVPLEVLHRGFNVWYPSEWPQYVGSCVWDMITLGLVDHGKLRSPSL